MSVTAVALYGSRARRDHERGSDTDLLMVTDEDGARSVSQGEISLSFYPQVDLIRLAADGDLFAGHLVLEAVSLWDPTAFFPALKEAWLPRSSYQREIGQATDLGLFLLKRLPRLATPEAARLVNRRIAWVVRTILIAASAEQGHFIYSAHYLGEFAGSTVVTDLIRAKSDEMLNARTIRQLESFLKEWGRPSDGCTHARTVDDFRQIFEAKGNVVSLGTIQALSRLEEHQTYI